jgi:ketosteroid isomerase-like protein
VSDANLELVRRLYREGLVDGDPEALVALATDDVEYVNPPEAVEPGTRRGRAEFVAAWRNLSNHFVGPRNDLREVFDHGDRVVASVLFRARSRGSDTEITQEEAHTWTLSGGRIARFEWGRDLQAALDAAAARVGSPDQQP